MKLSLPLFLRKALAVAFASTLALASQLEAKTVIYDGTGTSTDIKNTTGETFKNGENFADGDIIQIQTTDVLNYSGVFDSGDLRGVIVDAGFDGASIVANAGNNAHYINGFNGPALFDIKSDFTFDLYNNGDTVPGQYHSNFSVQDDIVTFQVAADKTFTLKGDIVGDDGGKLIITGGGTFRYENDSVADGDHKQHVNDTSFEINSGSTFDLSANNATDINALLLGGTVSMNQGTIHLMSGAVSIANALSISGSSNSFSGADSLTLTGDISLSGAPAGSETILDFGSMDIDLSGITFSLDDSFIAGQSYNFVTGTGTITGWTGETANFTLSGIDASAIEWSYDSTNNIYSFMLTQRAAIELTWSGGNGNLAEDVGGWNDSKTFKNNDSIVLAGDTGIISVDGAGVTLGGITVSGNNDYTLDGGSISMTGHDIIKNGSGTLTIATSGNNITDSETYLNVGTLVIGANNALGTGKIHISSGTTLEVADGVTQDTGVTTAYTRAVTNYTIKLGQDSKLIDNSRNQINGGHVQILSADGATGGVLEVDAFGFAVGSKSHSQLTIGAGATLKIKGTVTSSDSGGTGSFAIAEHPTDDTTPANVVHLYGTLDLASGISARDGSGIINVYDSGELILRQGLLGVTKTSTARDRITLNINSGGTLTLFNKGSKGSSEGTVMAPTVNMASGSTLQAGEAGTTTISDSLNFVSTGNYDVAVATGQTIVYSHDLSVGTLKMVGDGILTVNNVTLNSPSRSGSGSATIVSTTGDTVSIQNKTAGVDGLLTSNTISDVTLSNVEITGVGQKVTLANVSISNATLTNVIITDQTTLGENLTLTNTQIDTSLLTTTLGAETSFTTIEGNDVSGIKTFEIAGLTTLTGIPTFGQLTLDLGDVVGFADPAAGELIAFSLDVDSLNELVTTGYYGSITLLINGVNYAVLGSARADGTGDVLVYIPEPSTATLSLLALTGLLARRRRQRTN